MAPKDLTPYGKKLYEGAQPTPKGREMGVGDPKPDKPRPPEQKPKTADKTQPKQEPPPREDPRAAAERFQREMTEALAKGMQ